MFPAPLRPGNTLWLRGSTKQLTWTPEYGFVILELLEPLLSLFQALSDSVRHLPYMFLKHYGTSFVVSLNSIGRSHMVFAVAAGYGFQCSSIHAAAHSIIISGSCSSQVLVASTLSGMPKCVTEAASSKAILKLDCCVVIRLQHVSILLNRSIFSNSISFCGKLLNINLRLPFLPTPCLSTVLGKRIYPGPNDDVVVRTRIDTLT